MSKLALKILEKTEEFPTSKNVCYLIEVIRKIDNPDFWNEIKLRLISLSSLISETVKYGKGEEALGLFEKDVEIMKILFEKMPWNRHVKLRLGMTLSNFRYNHYKQAVCVLEEMIEDSEDNLEKIKILFLIMQARSQIVGFWEEKLNTFNHLKKILKLFLSKQEEELKSDMTLEDILFLSACCYWLSGYIDDDLESLEISNKVSLLVRKKIIPCLSN